MRSLALALVVGCGSHPTTPDALTVDAPVDAMRLQRIAASGARVDPTTGVALADVDLATDADVIAIHQDFFGIPWDEFSANAPPPAAWAAAMTDIADRAHAMGKPIFLGLAPLAGDRAHLAGKVVAGGVQQNWMPACYVDATLTAAYARYVDYMVALFQPTWTNIAIEVSEFHITCPAQWDGMVALERAAYDAAKARAPDVPAFPSIQLDPLYGKIGCAPPMTPDDCYESEYASLAMLKRDRFAVSTYPYAFLGFATPQDIPADWFTRAASRGGERLLIAETGWLGTDLVATDASSQCTTVVSDPASEAADYFDRLLADARANDVELITWISDRDFVATQLETDCPCTFSTSWCSLLGQVRGTGDASAQLNAEVGFKIFGAMGMRDYDGVPRQPLYDHVQAARN